MSPGSPVASTLLINAVRAADITVVYLPFDGKLLAAIGHDPEYRPRTGGLKTFNAPGKRDEASH